MPNLEDIKMRYNKAHAKKEFIDFSISSKKKSLTMLNIKIKDYEKIHAIWIKIAKEMQTKAITKIETIVTMAIQTVFQRNYQFKLVFEEKRNNIACTPLVIEGDKEYSPKDSMGGGMLDIIGFALRITLWWMRYPNSRNTFFLDEPFKFCGGLTPKAALMLKKLSQQLNFQVLLVTHNEDLKTICDRTWSITKHKFSKIERLKND